MNTKRARKERIQQGVIERMALRARAHFSAIRYNCEIEVCPKPKLFQCVFLLGFYTTLLGESPKALAKAVRAFIKANECLE